MTDEEIIHNVLENNLHTEKEGYLLVAKAIRADERAKVLERGEEMSKESVRGEIAKIIATVDHDVDMDEEVADQILDLLKRDRWVKLVKGDKVICKTAWDLLSPVVQKGLEVNQQEAGYKKVKDGQ